MSRCQSSFLVLSFAILLPLQAAAADVPLVDEKVRQLMQDGQYAQAVTAIDTVAAAEDAPEDYLAYLKGRALYLSKEYDQAIQWLGSFQEKFPDSPWTRRARFAKAMALARKGDFRSAELIYRDEAEHLLSVDRKQEIADIYLEFADKYFDPPKEDEKPDYAKALEFYGKALEVGPKPEKQIEIELLLARCHQELDQADEAAKRFEQFISRHADSPLVIEARYRLGHCRLKQDQLKQARRTWQDLLAKHADSESERIPEATFYLSQTWRIPEPGTGEDLNLGVAALERFLAQFPTHKLVGQAYLDIGKSYMHRGRHDEAATSLAQFLEEERYRDREEIPDARNLLGQSYQLQKKFVQALGTWRDYLAKHPAHEAWSSVQRQIIETEYLMGLEEQRAKRYGEARKLWTEFIAKYPLDQRHPDILYLFGEMHFQQKKWKEAIADWERLVSKYPETEQSSRGQFMIALTLEQKLGRMDEALEAYRKVTWGQQAPKADLAVARLTAKDFTVETERVFRSDEIPVLKFTSRNIQKVTVRVYSINLETYFRKMHLARGVEDLDIALIDPNQSFEFEVPDYAEYQELESTIEVSFPNAATSGVAAVTVASEKLETTTLVVQSDLDVIMKSSRDEVFVLAENMLTGQTWPGVRLLISDGQEVFAEGVTGDDGVFQQAYEELEDPEDVRVFAVMDGHVASNVVSLEGVGVARGLTDKGYIYTDRPAYRAGQLVHVRGCLRHVPGGSVPTESVPVPAPAEINDLAPSGPGPSAPERAVTDEYVIEEGKKFQLQVFDGRNRPIWQEEIALGPFGTFHTHFLLPKTSPQGEYRILVKDESDRSYQGTFGVHEYKLEPVRLVIDTPRRVYYRGEEIEGTIRAEFYYGAPIVGRQIRYQLADERLQTAKTDGNGEVHFKLPTREFGENQILPLAVTLPERNVQTGANFFLATQGFSVGVSTVRPVYVAGETFEVTIQTHDAEGKPVGRKLSLAVVEKTEVDGKVGERVADTYEIETAESDGSARRTLKIDGGGRYVLRVEGADRFGNPVSGEHLVGVSDEDDKVRLRILADRHTYKVGDAARIRLHWREEPALGLVTYQGARVLDYELVQLQKGANELTVPMTARLAPNFELAVAVMTDGRERSNDKQKRRFHTASSPFTVERQLQVNLSYGRKEDPKQTIRPGDEIEVTITTTDPQGKPVAAEVSLAMIERSLLDRFVWPHPPIQDFFRGEHREPAVRTTSTITFDYRPKTQAIDPQLLAERERLEIARAEADGLDSLSWGSGLERAGRGGRAAGHYFSYDAFSYDVDNDTDGVEMDYGAEHESARGIALGRRVQSLELMVRPKVLIREEESRMGGVGGMAGYGGYAHKSGGGYGGSMVAGKAAEMGVELGLADSVLATEVYSVADLVLPLSPSTWSMQADGTFEDLQLGLGSNRDPGDVASRITELSEAGTVLFPHLGPQETGYWNPAVTTDEDGKATVTFRLPERSTAWTLLAKGITEETLAGEAEEDLTVSKELFGELKLPLAFTEGDEADVLATVHNDAIEKGEIHVTLKSTIDGRSVEEKKTLDVTSKGIHELTFKTKLDRPDAERNETVEDAVESRVTFELTVAAQVDGEDPGGSTDLVTRSVPLKPFGVPVFATASGTATSDTTAWVEAPEGMTLEAPSLEILVGPTIERSLLDIVLGPARWCQIEASRIASGLDTTTSDLMASLALQKLLGASRDAGGPQAQALDARIRSSLSLLVSSQSEDGGWSWTGRGGNSSRYATARAVWAISLAQGAGYRVPDDAYGKAVSYLRGQVAAADHTDYESQSILLHGLATAGQGDFALANRLYRARPSLSAAALAHLALAFLEMDRTATAEEILQILDQRDLDSPGSRRTTAMGALPWNHSAAELRALYTLAVQEATPASPKAKESVDWLLAHRTGHRWAPDKATGPAALALCQWFGSSRFEGEHYRLAVFVNDVQAKVLDIDAASATQVITVPRKMFVDGRQRINFQITGRGRYTYQCTLGGFVPAADLKSTTAEWEVKRTHEPAPLEVDGREIPRGFGVLAGSYTTFRNPLTQLPVGQRGVVELSVKRKGISANTPEDHLEYLVITEPIPGGTTVIQDSVKGGFERFEMAPGAITFYVGGRRHVETIRYELRGYLPGEYRAGPTQVRNAYRPEMLVVAEPKPLAVLPMGAKSSDSYRLTPQELYELGKRHFDGKNLETAGKHLTELVENWNLKNEVYKDSVGKLLDVHLELGPPAKVVHYFEVIKEKWPSEEIPFDKIVKVGAAYHEMGEYERSYLIFRATVESSFARESRVAGFLQSQGEFLRSVDVMGRLLGEYPPEGYVAAGTYAMAQRVYAKAPEAASDQKLREAKITRVDLIRRAWTMLENFLSAYPDDPAADQAGFAAANALLELKAYDQATDACNRYAERYPKSDLLDSFWYMIGYCHFATGKHKLALDMCTKVAVAEHVDAATGRRQESPNKWQAIYILGQVHHSLGQAADAIREYRRVEDRFADAKEAIEYFVRKSISVPEVTTVHPGKPKEVELSFRNIASCDVRVYRIDLMKFSLLRRNLGQITQINLAGIDPFHETTIKLGDGRDYRDRTHRLPLPLEGEGAYLIVCRGENLYSSGLVLVTPLAAEVQEDVASGRVRTTVKDTTDDRYLSDVHVKVIGTRNDEFVTGQTDLRGVFIADGIQGTSTVIAKKDPSLYAFFRGKLDLVPALPEPPKDAAAEGEPAAEPAPAAPLEQQLLKGLQDANTARQLEQVEQLDALYESEPEGVAPSEAF